MGYAWEYFSLFKPHMNLSFQEPNSRKGLMIYSHQHIVKVKKKILESCINYGDKYQSSDQTLIEIY